MQNVPVDRYSEFVYTRAVECVQLLAMIDKGLSRINQDMGFFQKFSNRKQIRKFLLAKKAINNLFRSYAISYISCRLLTDSGMEFYPDDFELSGEIARTESIAMEIFKHYCT